MIWKKIEFYKAGEENVDELGNNNAEQVPLSTSTGIVSAWNVNDVTLLGRELTTSARKLITKAIKDTVTQADKVKIGGELYEIEQVIDDSPRWRTLAIRKWRK